MSKFQFRLSPLVKIRENIRTEKQAELAKAREAAEIVEEHLRKLHEDLHANQTRAKRRIECGTIDVDYLLALRRHEAFLLGQQQHARSQLAQIQAEIERRTVAVVEADREVKILEKLREKMRQRHRDEEALAQLKQLDEIAQQKTFRNIKHRHERRTGLDFRD